MKILQIIPSLGKGGAERITLNICKELIVQGHEVKLLVLHPINNYSFISEGINIVFSDIKFHYSIKGKHRGDLSSLKELIYSFAPNIIHAHLFESLVALTQINYSKAKYIIHFHDNMSQFKKQKIKFSKDFIIHYIVRMKMLNFYKNKIVSCIGISTDTLEFINLNVPNYFKSYLLFNSIDRERFLPQKSLRRKPLSLLMIGSLVDKKNQQLAINALRILHNYGYNCTLEIIGEGPNEFKLRLLVEDLELGNYVSFLGNVDYPENFLSTRFLFLHTAIYEPFGLVFLEAMTSKIPIVCVDGKGNRDLITNNINGIILKDFSPENIAKNIINIIENNELYEGLLSNAFDFSKSYSINNYVKKLVEIYNIKD